ncbi:MAG: NAD(P)H-binding protein [Anaerolineae bacterium]|nr:NAD(P)H-binding protein [Anaerolineae bacterium]
MSTPHHTPLRCCVLGATGFIGGQIARAAVAQGWQVRGVRRQPAAVGAVGDLALEWVTGDLNDPASLVTAMRGCPLVFHAAGYDPNPTLESREAVRYGVTTMRNVLTAAAMAGVKRVIYTSSFTTIGPSPDPLRLASEQDFYVPGSVPFPYFEVKWAMEMEAVRATVYGLPVVIVVPGFVLGPGDVKPTSGKLLLMIAQGKLRGYLEGEVNVVDVRDVATGALAAARRGTPGHRYILGGHNLTLRELHNVIAGLIGRKPPTSRQSLTLSGKEDIPGSHRLQAIRYWRYLDTAQARTELGLSEPLPLEQTCQDALAWFRERGILKS